MKRISEALEFLENFDGREYDRHYEDFEYVLDEVKVMTGVGIMYVLNTLCQLLSDKECYLEFGTNGGSTLVGAGYRCPNPVYGLDNFKHHTDTQDKGSDIKDVLNRSIEKFAPHAKYFESDGYDFISSRKDIEGNKVSVYFYDRDHGTDSTIKGVTEAEGLFSDKAIILLDDISDNDRGRLEAAMNHLDSLPQYTMIKKWHPKVMKGALWCGLAAYLYEAEKK